VELNVPAEPAADHPIAECGRHGETGFRVAAEARAVGRSDLIESYRRGGSRRSERQDQNDPAEEPQSRTQHGSNATPDWLSRQQGRARTQKSRSGADAVARYR